MTIEKRQLSDFLLKRITYFLNMINIKFLLFLLQKHCIPNPVRDILYKSCSFICFQYFLFVLMEILLLLIYDS